MKLTCNRQGTILLLDADPMIVRELKHWFHIQPTNRDNVWAVPMRKVWALIGRYENSPQFEVTSELGLLLEKAFSFDATMKRIKPALKHYRGGYQAHIVAHAVSQRRHALLTDMGSGKSVMASEIARLTGPTILIAPPGAWYNAYVNPTTAKDGLPKGDLLRFYPNGKSGGLRYGTYMGSARKKDRTGLFRVSRDLYAVSPFLLGGVMDEILAMPLATLIVDESSFARSSSGQLFKSLKQLIPRCRFRYVMSGYPYPKNLGNLWTQIHLIDSACFRTEREFIKEYASKKGKTASVSQFTDRVKSRAILQRLTDRKLVTCLSQEEFWPERPKLTRRRVMVALSKKEREEYDRAEKSLMVQHGEEALRISDNRNVLIQKLRELAAGFIYRDKASGNGGGREVQLVSRPSKMRALHKLMAGACRGSQVVICYHFEAEIRMIQKTLDNLGVTHAFYQGTSKDAIQALHSFARGDARVLITHPQSAGHGIRLTEACHMIFTSVDWVSDYHEQAIKRLYRPPQRRDVTVWYLCAEETKDSELLDHLMSQAHARDTHDAVLRKGRIALPAITAHIETRDERQQRKRRERSRPRQETRPVAPGSRRGAARRDRAARARD